MYIQQNEYVPALAAEAGVRVLIHPKGTAPFPEDDGLSIPAAHSTSLGIRKVRPGDPTDSKSLGERNTLGRYIGEHVPLLYDVLL